MIINVALAQAGILAAPHVDVRNVKRAKVRRTGHHGVVDRLPLAGGLCAARSRRDNCLPSAARTTRRRCGSVDDVTTMAVAPPPSGCGSCTPKHESSLAFLGFTAPWRGASATRRGSAASVRSRRSAGPHAGPRHGVEFGRPSAKGSNEPSPTPSPNPSPRPFSRAKARSRPLRLVERRLSPDPRGKHAVLALRNEPIESDRASPKALVS